VDAWPAQCSSCGGLSYVGSSLRHIAVIAVPMFIGLVLFAGWGTSVLVGLGGLIVLLAGSAWYMARAPLVPTTPVAVRFMRRWYIIGWSLVAALVAYAAWNSPNHVP